FVSLVPFARRCPHWAQSSAAVVGATGHNGTMPEDAPLEWHQMQMMLQTPRDTFTAKMCGRAISVTMHAVQCKEYDHINVFPFILGGNFTRFSPNRNEKEASHEKIQTCHSHAPNRD